MGMSITLDIPNNLHEALHVSPAETEPRLKLELAVALYAQNTLGLGKAAELAGMSRLELNDILAERGIPMHYGQQELDEDLAYVGHSQ
jgi:predicted HTH domain antitoxin